MTYYDKAQDAMTKARKDVAFPHTMTCYLVAAIVYALFGIVEAINVHGENTR